jgi:8-oxo-dGTP diphosphatase
MPDYDKVGLLTMRGQKILLCRKKHTTALLILPGGCREPGESTVDCLARELKEELGEVTAHSLEFLGTYESKAAGSDTKIVRIELYRGDLTGEPAPHAEIKELVWFGPDDDEAQLAPSLRNVIFPDLRSRGVLPESQTASANTSR